MKDDKAIVLTRESPEESTKNKHTFLRIEEEGSCFADEFYKKIQTDQKGAYLEAGPSLISKCLQPNARLPISTVLLLSLERDVRTISAMQSSRDAPL